MAMEMMENWALQAYADGQLGSEEARAVEALLARSEEARNLVADIRRQKDALHRAFDPVLEEPIPPALLRAARQAPPVASAWPRLALAASLTALVLGGGAGWFGHILAGGQAMAGSLPQHALDAYAVYGAEVKHPVEVSAAEKDHLQAWLSKRIGVKFTVPDLSAKGYSLLGGRLLAEGAKPAALLFYEDANKQRLAIYIASNDGHGSEPMKIEHRGQLITCYWVEPEMVYALAGEQPASEMVPLAEAAHDGFDKES